MDVNAESGMSAENKWISEIKVASIINADIDKIKLI